ncbi:LysM peptidoglycan-binding domain-containing protein [Neobacillus sp. NPDC058068]|uniref:cell division suppressor protein YneA n=1 Tax=Neobacillus sp. NPDC058068 TaxID=3346325 RepID=UPI0036DEB354
MRKIWNQYSYAITLIILSCSFAIVLSIQNHTNDKENYLKVKISEGDSLWEISKQYSEQHTLSNEEFVGWVKRNNKNIDDHIFPGEEIIIPVNKITTSSTTELAGAFGD